eukprot:TRINITY_DN524_c0_g1_i1.p1 TRINITY_DN524_c0_g1~~TRINITY_DN524_c0_g1_i1.p1  ORF type:complete len:498 (-),score=57.90 TRINITY_DN524_c0_g1_i1:72-1565(-)
MDKEAFCFRQHSPNSFLTPHYLEDSTASPDTTSGDASSSDFSSVPFSRGRLNGWRSGDTGRHCEATEVKSASPLGARVAGNGFPVNVYSADQTTSSPRERLTSPTREAALAAVLGQQRNASSLCAPSRSTTAVRTTTAPVASNGVASSAQAVRGESRARGARATSPVQTSVPSSFGRTNGSPLRRPSSPGNSGSFPPKPKRFPSFSQLPNQPQPPSPQQQPQSQQQQQQRHQQQLQEQRLQLHQRHQKQFHQAQNQQCRMQIETQQDRHFQQDHLEQDKVEGEFQRELPPEVQQELTEQLTRILQPKLRPAHNSHLEYEQRATDVRSRRRQAPPPPPAAPPPFGRVGGWHEATVGATAQALHPQQRPDQYPGTPELSTVGSRHGSLEGIAATGSSPPRSLRSPRAGETLPVSGCSAQSHMHNVPRPPSPPPRYQKSSTPTSCAPTSFSSSTSVSRTPTSSCTTADPQAVRDGPPAKWMGGLPTSGIFAPLKKMSFGR